MSVASLRHFSVPTAVAVCAALVGLPQVPAVAAGPEPADVGTLRAGLGSLAQVFIGEYEETGPLAQAMLLSDTTPGAAPLRPGDALDLAAVLTQGVTDKLLALQGSDPVDSVAALAAQVDGSLDDTVAGSQVQVSAGNVVNADSGRGFDLTIAVSRTAQAAVALTDPTGPGGQALTLRSPATAPFDLAFTFTATLRTNAAGDLFWLTSGPSTPSVRLDADLAGAGAYDFPAGDAAIGVGDVTTLDGSTVDLDASWAGSISDTNGDGRLTIAEPALDGTGTTPGELTMPASALTAFTRSGTATADVQLGSALVPLDSSPAPTMTLDADLATAADLVADLTGSAGDLDDLAAFTRISPVDLVSGLIQYATTLRALQQHPNVDAQLPLAGGRLSDLGDLGADVSDLADSLIEITPFDENEDPTDDPTDGTAPQIVEVKIQTIGDLADKLDDLATYSGGTLQPTYDSATQRVTLDVAFAKALDGLATLDLPTGSEVAQLTFGDQLRGTTGLRGVSTPDESPIDPKVDLGYNVDLPMLVDLTAASSADDDPETSVVEFESPMVFERFEAQLKDGAEVDLTTLVDTNAKAAAQIGFVPAQLGGTYKLKQDGTSPTTAADVDPADGQTATPRLVDLMAGLQEGEGNPAEYPVSAATRHLVVDADLTMNGHGARPEDVLTSTPGAFTVDGTGLDVSAYTTALTNDPARMLKSLDVDSTTPSRLLGRIIDTATEVGDSVDAIDSGLESAGLDVPNVPLLDKTAGALLSKAVGLKKAIDDLRAGPTPVDLADVETKLQGLLDSETAHGIVGFTLRDLDPADGTVDPALVLRFDVDKADSAPVPISLDAPGVPNLVSSGDSGQVTANVAGSVDLGLLVPLNPEGTATPPVRILEGSKVEVTGSITESPAGSAQLSVAIGALKAQLGDSTNHTGRLALGAKIAVGRPGAPAPGSADEEPLELADYFDSGLDLALTSADPSGTFTCAPPGGLAATEGTFGCASLPVLTTLTGSLKTLGGSEPDAPTEGDYLKISIDDLASPDVDAPANLGAVLDTMDFSFDGLDDGFASIAKLLEVAIAASTLGGDLPLVGEDLTKLAGGLTSLKDFLANPGAVLDVPFDTDPTVQEVLFDAGGLRDLLTTQLGGLGILRDGGYQPVYAGDPDTDQASDIRIVPVCAGALCALSADATTIDEIRVELELGQGSRGTGTPGVCTDGNGTTCPGEVDLPIDLGLDGFPLRFQATDPAKARAGWTLELGFGLSREDGFYLLDNPVPGTGVPDAEPADGPEEVRVNLGVDLFATDATKLKGTIGFITMEASDNKTGAERSGARLLAQAGLDAPGACTDQAAPFDTGLGGVTQCTGKVPGTSLVTGDPSQFLGDATLEGGVDLDLKLQTGLGTGTLDKTLPSFLADFTLLWEFGTGTGSTPTTLPEPEIGLHQIRVDAGELFKKTFDDVFGAVGDVLEPTQEVRDFLFTPIPVISDISEYFGQGTIAMIDIARAFGFADTRLLKDINEVLDFIAAVTSLGSAELVLIEDLEIDAEEATGPAKTPDQVKDLYPGADFPELDLGGKFEDALGSLADEWDSLGLAEGGDGDDFTYPVIDDPSCLVGLLLGNDCVIVEWRPDPLAVKASYPLSFGPFFGVLYVTFGGELEASGNFGGGVSTRGVRMLGERLLAGEPGLDAGVSGIAKPFFQSLYLVDHDRSGKDVPEFEVTGRIKAGAKFDALIVAAGIDGGIEASFSLNLNDTPQADGRMYIDEIIEKIQTPICLFDIKGKLSAFLEAWARFGVCPFCHTETWRLATITLFEWSNKCDPEPPVLAREEGAEGNRVVYLNVGVDKGLRKSLNGPEHDNEAYVVRQMSAAPDDNGEYDFTISAFGYSEKRKGERIVVTNSAEGDDSFLFQGGGNLNDASPSTWPFTARVDAALGIGNDAFVSGSGPDTVEGNGGDDSINVGDGTNTAWGDAASGTSQTGNDTLIGGKGVDELYGGPLNDSIDGGPEADKLHGNGGIDKLHGGHDISPVPTGVTPPDGAQTFVDKGDEIVGGGGNDTLNGGSGDDRLYGDELTGLAISDDQPGAETVDDEAPGNDLIEGGAGEDRIWGGRGNDVAHGGFILAADGSDQSGDHLQGNGGNDELRGSFGGDHLWGGPDTDRIFGDDGDDDGHGQSGNDPDVRGGPGGDQLFGGAGDDNLSGDGGNDEIVGDGDGALLDGADAAKRVGDDTTDGGAGEDIVLGDNGTVTGPADNRQAQPHETNGVDDSSLGGGAGDDRIYGEGGDDTLFGGEDRDLLHGNGGEDTVNGQTGADEAWGDADSDTLYGGTDADVVFGNGADDDVHGQEGDDLLVGGHPDPNGGDTGDTFFGGPDDDRIFGDDVTIAVGGNNRYDASDEVSFVPSGDASTYGGDLGDGGTGLDEMHGQDGEDTLFGAQDHDQIFGELGSDQLHGEGGPDYIVGDRGTVTPRSQNVTAPAGGWVNGTPNGSPDLEVALVAPSTGSPDFIWGDFNADGDPWSTGGDDHAWGGAGNDVMRGGAYDDYLEGNDGQDRIFGFDEDSDHATDGEDDLVGGSSPVNPQADPDGTNSAPDAGEVEMQGNGQEDVMAGDNAILTRVPDPGDPGAWKVDPVTGGVFRTVQLLDTEKSGPALDTVSGGDFMVGNDENDRMFGEGGNDLVKGNDHDDLVEGNQDGDWLEGNNDEDDLVGGSSFPDQPDTNDVLWGGGGADVLAGDNACVVRQATGVAFEPSSCPALDQPAPTAFHYVTSQLGVETPRGLVLHDLDAPVASEFGADQLNGGSDVDVEFGQDGTDFLFGDGGADFQHGNGHADVVVGDRPVSAYGGIVLPPEVGGTLPPLAAIPAGLPGTPSTGVPLVGPPQADGQDDQIGGSNRAATRDAGDWIFGDGEADFQLGDNGELNRTVEGGDHYAVYEERYDGNNPPGNAVIERDVTRYDVGASAASGFWGPDLIFGGNGTNPLISQGAGDGDDSQWGQDGDDKLFGEDGNDDQFGELGNDLMWGGAGEDAMVGDRGGVQTRFVEVDGSDGPDPDVLTHNSQGPPGINLGGSASGPQDATLRPFHAHPLWRGTSLSHDRDGSALTQGGHAAGGNDTMRGGPGHDSMHGARGNDLMNGDSGGDYLYGDDGADVMWGGRGRAEVLTPDIPSRNAMGDNGQWIDILFGGHGSSATEAGADIIDYQPRAGVDPAVWFETVKAYADTAPENSGAEGRQHHHGTDWEYGGWDRDVLQGDVAANGPNDGDKMLDWAGAYNLYTHCNAAYGGWNDVRKVDPNNILGLEKLAYVTGATTDFDGPPVLGDVQSASGSAYREVAIVYTKDLKNNTGKAFSSTPGHFEDFICNSD